MAELKWVHDMIRQDLAVIRQLAVDTTAGTRLAAVLRRSVRSLVSASPVWQLKVGCLQHCRFVHAHHSHESYLLFPALREANPALNPVVDKLEADHQRVARLLDDVAAAAQDLDGPEQDGPEQDGPGLDGPARDRLAAALATLSTDLLAHLAYEEEQISGTLRTFTHWPGW